MKEESEVFRMKNSFLHMKQLRLIPEEIACVWVRVFKINGIKNKCSFCVMIYRSISFARQSQPKTKNVKMN